MTQPIGPDEAAQVLSPHLQSITDCLHNGWKHWRDLVELDAERGVEISTRSRASLVYDFICAEAKKTFDQNPHITISESRGFLLLTIDSKIVIRFKKFRDGGLRTNGIVTQQSREFANQVLPGMEAVTHLVAGYLPDDDGLGLRLAAITCTLDKEQLWVLNLDLAFDESAATPPIPIGGHQDELDTIVRPKRAGEAARKTASEDR
ncbi:hypothetical protein [Streptomyces sp. NBC_01320]|uniref:hypothetical protein n=1 Tax=Streptomyces sp. NBC_01320 TaxID=2903824 RepID=UPI002E10167D|nr:hypothetical protein OG395_35275 [Streptomyces sp. NBC_01320]